MNTLLAEKLDLVRQRLRQIVWLHGLGMVLLGTLAVIVPAIFLDWLLHVSTGLRLLFLLATLTVFVLLAYRYLVAPLTTPITDLALALRIERLYPQLGEHLSSTVSFSRLDDSDPRAGSLTLRRQVMERAFTQAAPLDFLPILQWLPARRVGGGVFGVLIFLSVLGAVRPTEVAIGLQRLLNPFSTASWPQRTRLMLVSAPDKIAVRDPFRLEVDAIGVVPEVVRIHYRFANGEQPVPEPLTFVRNGRFKGGLEAVQRSFAYRLVGGDAETPWQNVEVMPAPELISLITTVRYPPYTGLPPETFPEGRGHVRAVIGSTITVAAVANKPLTEASLLWLAPQGTAMNGAGAAATNPPSPLPAVENGLPTTTLALPGTATLAEDRWHLTATFPVVQDADYILALRDEQGLSNASAYRVPHRYRVQAVTDAPPDVVLQKPLGDQKVTSTATVPLRVLVKDDFGLGPVRWQFSVQRKNDGVPETPAPVLLWESAEPQRQQTVEASWPLESLQLPLGAILQAKAVATDRRDTPGPNQGSSREVTFRIVSKDEFLKELETEQQLLREELDRALKLQETAQRQVQEAKVELAKTKHLDPTEREKLQGAELIQRRLSEKISDSDQSLRNRISEMLDRLQSNRIDESNVSLRLGLMRGELMRLAEQHFPPIGQALTRAGKLTREDANRPEVTASLNKTADTKPTTGTSPSDQNQNTKPTEDTSSEPSPDSQVTAPPTGKETLSTKGEKPSEEQSQPSPHPAVKSAEPQPAKENSTAAAVRELARANDHQQQVVDSLRQMLDQLDKWENVYQVLSDARDLQRRQGEVTSDLQKLAATTLGKQTMDLPAEQQAGLTKAADRQDDNREHLQRLEQQLDRLVEKTAREDTTTASLLQEAVDASRKANLGGRMAEAARAIRDNRMGNAAKEQQEINQPLADLVNSLENRREQELTRLVKQMKQAEKDLAELQQEQARLLQKTKAAQQQPEGPSRAEELKRLQKQQQQLEQKAEEFARRLSRLRAQQAGRQAGRAAGQMRQAGGQMGQGQAEQAGQQQQQALEDLQQAQQELAKARQQAENELAQEQLAKVSDAIRQVHQRELGIKEEVSRLDRLRLQAKRLSRGELQSLAGIARAQTGLAEEANLLIDKLTASKVFGEAIRDAVEHMKAAANKLSERETGQPAQWEIDLALRRFTQLLDSLRSDNDPQGKGKQQGGEGEGGGQPGNQEGIPDIAQIRLLKLLQTDLNERTTALVEARKQTGQWTSEQKTEFESLAKTQGTLANLVRDLTAPPEDKLEEPLLEPPSQPQLPDILTPAERPKKQKADEVKPRP